MVDIQRTPSEPSQRLDALLSEYYQTQEHLVKIGHKKLKYVTRPGLTNPRNTESTFQLFNAYIDPEPVITKSKRIFMLGAGSGLWPAYLALTNPSATVVATDITFTFLVLTQMTALANQLPNLQVFPDPASLSQSRFEILAEQAEAAILFLPKGRKLARRWLLRTYHSMSKNGVLYLLGANDEGVQAVAKDTAALFADANLMGYKKGSRVYRFTKSIVQGPQPEWANEAGITLNSWNEYTSSIRGCGIVIHTLPGVFSYDHVDEGTQLLLDHLPVKPGDYVLDMGCGCGIIGMAAAFAGAAEVHLADNHLDSVYSATENLHINNITNAKVFTSDLYNGLPPVRYDHILSNPPFHNRKAVDYQVAQAMIAGSYQRLNRRGSLTIVANRFLPYNRLMEVIFGNVTVLQENPRFYVLTSRREE